MPTQIGDISDTDFCDFLTTFNHHLTPQSFAGITANQIQSVDVDIDGADFILDYLGANLQHLSQAAAAAITQQQIAAISDAQFQTFVQHLGANLPNLKPATGEALVTRYVRIPNNNSDRMKNN